MNGHPMVAHSIMTVRDAKLITDWLVSSEDEEVIEIAKQYGAATPFRRSSELSTDDARNIDVVLRALKYMETHKEVEIDKSIQHKLLITVTPDGFLKSVK
jgi:CMP-N-acetylneuraminic acid synthetase